MTQKKFLTTEDLTNLYGIDEATVRALVSDGDLKALADRGTWKYRREDVDELIKGGKLHPTKELPTVDDVDFDETIGFAEESAGTSERADFLELDEDALSEQATIISSEMPQESDDLQLSFTEEPASSSDVQVFEPSQTVSSDSDIQVRESSAETPVISADEGSGSDVAAIDESTLGDEGLATSEGDSGLTLEASDSGLTLDTGDSGLTLEASDSGLTLDAGDSGLTLDGGDSGLSLEVVPDDAAPVRSAEVTQRAEQLGGDIEADFDLEFEDSESEGTRRLALEEKFAEEREFVDDDSTDDHTAVIMVDDEDAGDEDYVGTLSGVVDAGAEVEDLEVADDLEAAILGEDEDEFGTAEEEILEAGDEAFSDEFVGEAGAEEEEEEYLTPSAKAAAPREPSWGAMTAVMVFGATVLVGANFWLMCEGLMTMWSGSETSGPATALISTIAGMLG